MLSAETKGVSARVDQPWEVWCSYCTPNRPQQGDRGLQEGWQEMQVPEKKQQEVWVLWKWQDLQKQQQSNHDISPGLRRDRGEATTAPGRDAALHTAVCPVCLGAKSFPVGEVLLWSKHMDAPANTPRSPQ